MPGATIESQIQAAGVEIPADGPETVRAAVAEGVRNAEDAQAAPWSGILRFLTKRSPKAKIDSFHDHPLNWRRDPEGREGAAQLIRALTGWLGDVDFCIVDAIMGLLKLNQAGRPGPRPDPGAPGHV